MDFVRDIQQLIRVMLFIKLWRKSFSYKKPLRTHGPSRINGNAFGAVEKSSVSKALQKQGVEEVYIRLQEDMYNEGDAVIKFHKKSWRMHPIMFTFCLEEVSI